mmetsp:Transcript_130168/g.308832  ORF Transcript_130168/g.308832 Transcript_130168/m.308832 type:complete len:272 (-) Transcript_130168:3787-4602(-)
MYLQGLTDVVDLLLPMPGSPHFIWALLGFLHQKLPLLTAELEDHEERAVGAADVEAADLADLGHLGQLHVVRQAPVAEQKGQLRLQGQGHRVALLLHGAAQARANGLVQRVAPEVQRGQGAVDFHGLREVQHLCHVRGGHLDFLGSQSLQLLVLAQEVAQLLHPRLFQRLARDVQHHHTLELQQRREHRLKGAGVQSAALQGQRAQRRAGQTGGGEDTNPVGHHGLVLTMKLCVRSAEVQPVVLHQAASFQGQHRIHHVLRLRAEVVVGEI